MFSTSKSHAPADPFVTPAAEGRMVQSVGSLLIFKADAEETGGASTLAELRAAPGYETPFHVHHREHEQFYLLDGEIECHYGDGETLVVGPDNFVFLPRDVPHGFRVVSDDPLRMLVTLTPAGLEAFFVEVGTEVETPELPPPAEPDVEALVAAAAAYDLEILGPLPERERRSDAAHLLAHTLVVL